MKKIFALFILTLILCASLSMTAFAENTDNSCLVNKNFESIEWSGKTYLPFDNDDIYIAGDEYVDLNERFADDSTEELYDYTDIYYYDEYPYILYADLNSALGDYELKYFVEESCYADVLSTVSGETTHKYITETGYYGSEYPLTTEQIDAWINNGEKLTDTADKFAKYDTYALYSTDSGGALRKQAGLILREYGIDGGADTYYLINYKDYDRTSFYADGTFAMESDVTATVYKLIDTELCAALSEFYDTTPKDELDWMISNQLPEGIFFIITLIIFVLIPLAVIVISIIIMAKKKQLNPYRLSLTALIISAAVIIISYAVILILLI